MVTALLWLGLAVAQTDPAVAQPDPAVARPDPAATPAESAPPRAEDDPQTVIVYSEFLAEQARKKVMQEAQDMGYTKVIERGDRVLLRHELPWKGDVVLHDDGRMEFKRQPVRFQPPFNPDKPASWLACVLVPICIRPGGQIVSPRKLHGYERDVFETLSDEVTDWNDRIADAATERKADGLPLRLEALWAEGTALDGSTQLTTFEQRKSAILDYWDTRTETDWGDRVRSTVESFVRGVVMQGDHPYTRAEVAAFDARRQSLQPFPFGAIKPVDPEDATTPAGPAAPPPGPQAP